MGLPPPHCLLRCRCHLRPGRAAAAAAAAAAGCAGRRGRPLLPLRLLGVTLQIDEQLQPLSETHTHTAGQTGGATEEASALIDEQLHLLPATGAGQAAEATEPASAGAEGGRSAGHVVPAHAGGVHTANKLWAGGPGRLRPRQLLARVCPGCTRWRTRRTPWAPCQAADTIVHVLDAAACGPRASSHAHHLRRPHHHDHHNHSHHSQRRKPHLLPQLRLHIPQSLEQEAPAPL